MSLRSASNSRFRPVVICWRSSSRKPFQLAGDLADGRNAVLLAAQPLDVARQRAVGRLRLRLTRGAGRLARASNGGSLRRGAGSQRPVSIGGSGSRSAKSRLLRLSLGCAADALLQRLEGAVELLHRTVRACAADLHSVFRDKTVCCSSKRPLAHLPLAFGQPCSIHCRGRTAPRVIAAGAKASSGAMLSLRPKAVNNSIQDRHGRPTCAHFSQRGKQGVNQSYRRIKKSAKGRDTLSTGYPCGLRQWPVI